LFPGSVDGGVSDVFDEDVRFTVKDAVALLDGAAADGLDTFHDRIEKEVTLRAPVSRVWKAITDAAEFGRWSA
jgi:hypothetical protein